MLKSLIISFILAHLSSEQEVFYEKSSYLWKKNDFDNTKTKENRDTWLSFLAADHLMADNANLCLMQTLCIITVDQEIDGQSGRAVQQILRWMSAEMRTLPRHQVDRLEHISKLIRAIDTNSVDSCMELLPCQEDVFQNDQQNPVDHGEQSRFQRTLTNDTCSIAGRVCPSLALTCGFCVHLRVEPCFILCPISNLVCGPLGVTCYVRKKLTGNDAEETNNTPINESMDMLSFDDKENMETMDMVDEISSAPTSSKSDQLPILTALEDPSLPPTSGLFADPMHKAVDFEPLKDDTI